MLNSYLNHVECVKQTRMDIGLMVSEAADYKERLSLTGKYYG